MHWDQRFLCLKLHVREVSEMYFSRKTR